MLLGNMGDEVRVECSRVKGRLDLEVEKMLRTRGGGGWTVFVSFSNQVRGQSANNGCSA